MQLTTFLTLTMSPLMVSAATHSVSVGQNGELKFNPSTITATAGDTVDFHFFPKNHSVVASSFAVPCVPIQPDGGIFSGFVPTAAESPNVFQLTVNDTKPIWIYCAQGKHCQSGMSMVINEPSGPNTLEAYQAAAKDVAASASPPDVGGGVFVTGAGNGTSGNGSYTSSATPKATESATPSAGFTGGVGAVKPVGGVVGVGALLGGVMLL